MRPLLLAAATLCVIGSPMLAPPARAQSTDTTQSAPQGPVLTLDQAITLALKNNPTHLQTVNNRSTANAAVRTAYGQLLPSLSASIGGGYRKSGAQPFQGLNLGATADVVSSNYSLNVGYRLGVAQFLQPSLASANANAAQADINGSAANVRMLVTQQYLTALESQAKAALQDTLVTQAQGQLELAKARLAVGSGTQLDVSKAEVTLGQAQVAALQAHDQVEIDKLTLFQQMGVPQPADVQLVSTFTVEPVPITLDSALDLAHSRNPALQALRARDKAAGVNVKVAKSQYLPTLSFNTGWGGYTQSFTSNDYAVATARQSKLQQREGCFSQDSLRVGAGLPSISSICSGIDFGPADAAAARRANDVFPFGFTSSPWSFNVSISLPIFDGFQREQNLQQAQANRNDARYQVRAQELQLTQAVTSAYLTLETEQKTIAMQQHNAETARQGLELAQEKYRVGAATFLDLNDATVTYAQAENAYITAIYDYHKAFATLESAVGRPLR
ncbi:MAG TPA: TolC family protein [Gemmatimonadaceae bacterium]|nr:TolC family protein [Gemmatimonadaceae bacterium]